MSIVEQIEQTKQAMKAVETSFQRGGLAITEALQKAAQFQELQQQLADLRMHQQFATTVEIILGDGDELEGPGDSDVGPRLHRLAVHIVSQLYPQATAEEVLNLVDGLEDRLEHDE